MVHMLQKVYFVMRRYMLIQIYVNLLVSLSYAKNKQE
jgi:hypothetical protein